jgi:hypothetical protein
MRNSKLILVLIVVLLFYKNDIVAQQSGLDKDSANVNVFYSEISKAFFTIIGAKELDTVNFRGVYSFLFTVSETGTVNIKNSVMAKPAICSVVEKSLVSAIMADSSYRKKIANKKFILPVIINYQVNYWEKMPDISFFELIKLFVYEKYPNKRPSFDPYTGKPIEGILLNAIYYEAPHVSTNKKYEKLKKAKSL